MTELIVRPSLKKVKWSVFIATAALAGVAYVYVRFTEDLAWWFLLIGAIPYIAPLAAWLDTMSVRLTVNGGVVAYESGLMKKERRLSALSEISGVTVQRNFTQRLWGTGTLVVETKGPAGRFVIQDVDRVRQVADALRNAAAEVGGTK